MSAITAAVIAGSGAVIAGVGGGLIASAGQRDAAEKQTQAANYAAQLQAQSAADALAEQKREYNVQKDAYDLQVANQKPWLDTGKAVLPQLQTMAQTPVSFTAQDFLNNVDPSYQFNMKEGLQALDRSAAARGGLLSGGAAKDVLNYSQGLASREYQNAYNRYLNNQNTNYARLTSLAGLVFPQNPNSGYMAGVSGNISGISQLNGQNLANIAIGAGNAQAAGAIGNANAWAGSLTSAVNNGTNTFMQYQNMNLMKQFLDKLTPPSTPNYGSYAPSYGGAHPGGMFMPGLE